MAPLLLVPTMHDSSEDVFSSARFAQPLYEELQRASRGVKRPLVRRRPRTVTISDCVSTINPAIEYYTDEDIEAKWFSAVELRSIKVRAKDTSNELRKESEDSRQCCIAVAHRKTTLMLKSDFRNLVKLSPSTPDQDLSTWCARDDGRRGLERFASRDYAALRRIDISNTRQAVIEEHHRQKTTNTSNLEVIANLSREASRRARTFSRFIAAADTSASKQPARPVRRLARCFSEARPPPVRCAPPRKRSKLDFYQVVSPVHR